MPELPLRLAVVTSPSGAAIRDFLRVLHERFAGIQVAVYPVLVQGSEAPAQMIRALGDLAAWGWPEVIVLTRGGGSPRTSWPLTTRAWPGHRRLAHPVGLGGGTRGGRDLADLAADLRAPTPTAAAELLARPLAELAKRRAGLALRLFRAGGRLVARRRERLLALRRGVAAPARRLADLHLRVDDLAQRAARALAAVAHRRARRLGAWRERLREARPDRRLAALAARLAALARRLAAAGRESLGARRGRLERATARLAALGPVRVLGRGYAVVTGEDGVILRRAGQARVGMVLGVRLAEGRLRARVEEVIA